MPSPLEVFDRISIINLPYRADRRREIRQQLARFGLSLDRDPVQLFLAVRPADADGFPNIGARGCFLSHLGVLKQARADGVAKLLILEDDVDFSKELTSERLGPILERLSSHPWAIAYGGHTLPRNSESRSETVWREIEPSMPVVTAHCVAMTHDAIALAVPYLEAILARPAGHAEGGPMHVDGAYSRLRADHPELVTYGIWPAIGHQRSSRTDIHELRWFDRWPVVSQIAETLRTVRRRLRRSSIGTNDS